MITNLVTSMVVALAGVPPAAVAPLLWNTLLLLGVRAAIRARDRRAVRPGDGAAGASDDELRSAA